MKRHLHPAPNPEDLTGVHDIDLTGTHATIDKIVDEWERRIREEWPGTVIRRRGYGGIWRAGNIIPGGATDHLITKAADILTDVLNGATPEPE